MLGQSFGGFCVCTYLSIAPEGLREAYITGGLPPLARRRDDVYAATYERVRERNRRYYARYPRISSASAPACALAGEECACRRATG